MDYVRNVSLHFMEGVDVNHVGDSRYLNKNAAAFNAIALTTGIPVSNLARAIDSIRLWYRSIDRKNDQGAWVPNP